MNDYKAWLVTSNIRLKGDPEMTVYEFGDETKPAIMLLPGTCYWKTNFGEVIPLLQEKFRVCVVSYDGFDDTETLCGLT